MESKAQKIERLRRMRQKYGLGEYKNKSRSIKSYRRVKMVKRKRSSRRRSYSGGVGIMATGVGVGAYILYEALLEPKVASVIGNGLILNVAELLTGAYLAKKGGVIGNVGKAAIVINTYQILQPLLANVGVAQ